MKPLASVPGLPVIRSLLAPPYRWTVIRRLYPSGRLDASPR